MQIRKLHCCIGRDLINRVSDFRSFVYSDSKDNFFYIFILIVSKWKPERQTMEKINKEIPKKGQNHGVQPSLGDRETTTQNKATSNMEGTHEERTTEIRLQRSAFNPLNSTYEPSHQDVHCLPFSILSFLCLSLFHFRFLSTRHPLLRQWTHSISQMEESTSEI